MRLGATKEPSPTAGVSVNTTPSGNRSVLSCTVIDVLKYCPSVSLSRVRTRASLAYAHKRYTQEHLFCNTNHSNIIQKSDSHPQVAISKKTNIYSIFITQYYKA